MAEYQVPILQAFLIFPFVAFLFTLPYMLIQYHKYGSLPLLRVGIVYSFILYLIAAYFLVILPLPTLEEVMNYTTPTMQLIPFDFITDIIRASIFTWNDPSTYINLITDKHFYQVFYNLILLLPFGIYLKYYFNCSFKKTVLYSFLLSLFFELTQLSGLYFIYPRGYRLFDVDDLLINTLGGALGYSIALLLLKFLPNRKKLDQYAYQLGTKMSGWKRIFTFLFDLAMITILTIPFIFIYPHQLNIVFGILLLIYFGIIPIFTKGKTFGKKFLNSTLVTLKEEVPKWYQYFFRYFLLFVIALPLPFYFQQGLTFISNYLPLQIKTTLQNLIPFIMLGINFLYYFSSFIQLLKGNLLFYEKLSHTKNKSTIKIEEPA